jgi:hypothetical protein
MPEESVMETLTIISRSLEEIKAILTLVHQKDLDRAKKGLLKEGSTKQRIYELCDGTRTTRELADAIGKELSYVNSYLSTLRREGLIHTLDKDGRQVHEQIF